MGQPRQCSTCGNPIDTTHPGREGGTHCILAALRQAFDERDALRVDLAAARVDLEASKKGSEWMDKELDAALSIISELRSPHMQLGVCRHCAAFATADELLSRYPAP